MRGRTVTKTGVLRARYAGLSPAVRRTVWVLLVAEAVLIGAAERDIHRRPTERIRGPKLLWRALATQNLIGPLAYFALARKGDG